MRIPSFIAKTLIGALITSSAAAGECLTPGQARSVVPYVENTAYDEVQDLAGPAYAEFLKIVGEVPKGQASSDEAMIFYRVQKGHGADIRVVWFDKGCAVAKASYPAEYWLVFTLNGKGA